MHRPRDVALRAGLYIVATLSGFAAAYVLKEWLPHLWGEARNTARVLPASDSPNDGDKTSPRSSLQQNRSPKTASVHVRQTDEVPTPASVTDPHPDHTLPAPSPNTDPRTPSASQTKTLPPLDTHSLPPPLPSGHALFSGSSFAINVDPMSSPTSAGSFHVSSDEDDVGDEAASQTNTTDTLEESFVDVLSPAPTAEISRRRSVRAHDLFAASHISFAELGSLVAPGDVHE